MTELQDTTNTIDTNALSTPKNVESVAKKIPGVMPRVVIVGAGFGDCRRREPCATHQCM